MFDKGTLVLEGVTLGKVVELVVEVLVNLAGGTVADEETAEDSHAAHPQEGAGLAGLLGTLALTQATLTADPASHVELAGPGAGVHGHGLADDKAILDELADRLAGVGVGDFVHLIRVEPDLALAAAHHGGGEALLGAKVDPVQSLSATYATEKRVAALERTFRVHRSRPSGTALNIDFGDGLTS